MTKKTTVKVSVARPRGSKKAMIERMVRRSKGATIRELTGATEWQPHSVRAALTGLRKDGVTIDRARDAKGVTRYRVIDAAALPNDNVVTS